MRVVDSPGAICAAPYAGPPFTWCASLSGVSGRRMCDGGPSRFIQQCEVTTRETIGASAAARSECVQLGLTVFSVGVLFIVFIEL
ncbi:hypothetical protein [Burkholderia stabilis]|uniref:hypothetical protein n=1 Tax=Burkholderia stabilis TaxID=95485 RepID=UPI001ABB26F5|nr:hypothetical protein [Burkholderia stabilis]